MVAEMKRLFCIAVLACLVPGCSLLPKPVTEIPETIIEVHKTESRLLAGFKADADRNVEALIRNHETDVTRWADTVEQGLKDAATVDGMIPIDKLAKIEATREAADTHNAKIFAAKRARWRILCENYEDAMRVRAVIASWMGVLKSLLEIGHGK